MKVKFEVDGQTYEIDTSRIMNTEAIAAQKVTGKNYNDWLGACDDGDIESITALVWIAMKRGNPELRFKDVEFPVFETWGNREYIVDDEVAADDADPTQADESAPTESN